MAFRDGDRYADAVRFMVVVLDSGHHSSALYFYQIYLTNFTLVVIAFSSPIAMLFS